MNALFALTFALAALFRLPVWKEDTAPELAFIKEAQLREVDRLVGVESRGDLKVKAFTLALGNHESRYSLRIMRGECRPRECDPRRVKGKLYLQAIGSWQLHRNGLSDFEWAALHGPDSLPAQAKEATKRARGALNTCRGDVKGAFAVLGGRGCKGSLPDMGERLETYRKLGGP